MEISEFYAARLDEDEAAARAAWPGPWDLETEVGGFGPVAYVLMPLPHKGARTGLTRYIPLGTQDADTAAHIARHDPARVLREVEAKRAILTVCAEAWRRYQDELDVDGSPKYDDGALAEWREKWDALEPVLRHVAAEFSDHPDYQESWKP